MAHVVGKAFVMMDPRLLDGYLRELQFMRAMSGEFAGKHPKIAKRLGMLGTDVADPFVDKLLQSAAFVNARAQLRFDDEQPGLLQPLLASCYPNYLSPAPAIAIARFYPGGEAGGFLSGDTIERGTELWAALPHGEKTVCTFRTTRKLALFPFGLTGGRLTNPPPDVQGLDRCVPPHRRVKGALRLRFRTLEDVPFSSLQGLDSLPIYLACDVLTASHVHELIHTGAVASIIGEPGRFGEAGYVPHVVKFNAVVQDGLGPDEAVLPLADAKFLGHNLVHEYACSPNRFYFFTLTGLQAGLARINGCEAEIIVLLDRSTSELAERVEASTFALFCVPIVNLFKARTPAKPIAEVGQSMRLVPFVDTPFDYEVFSVEQAIGQASNKEGAEEFPFHPLHAPLLYDEDGHDRYFTVYREQRLSNSKGRSYGTRVPYVGTESYLSLVRRDGQPFDDAHLAEEARIKYLSVDVWLTNRDLPGLLPCNGVSDLNMRGSASFSSIGFVRAPSRSRPPLGIGIKAWQLFAQLNIGHADFDDRFDEPNPGEGLRRLLSLYLAGDMPALRRQIESLTAATLAPVNCVVPEATPPMVRALECTVTFDEAGFDGVSPYAFGVVLERYLARHASTHSWTRTILQSKQRGRIAEWMPRPGTRSVA